MDEQHKWQEPWFQNFFFVYKHKVNTEKKVWKNKAVLKYLLSHLKAFLNHEAEVWWKYL